MRNSLSNALLCLMTVWKGNALVFGWKGGNSFCVTAFDVLHLEMLFSADCDEQKLKINSHMFI